MSDQRCGVFTTDAQLAVRTWDAWMESATAISAEDALGNRSSPCFLKSKRAV